MSGRYLNKRYLTGLVFVVCFLMADHDPHHDVPMIQKGVLDLKGWDLADHGEIPLNGEWEFYWQQFIKPELFLAGTNPQPDTYIEVPGLWDGTNIHGKEIDANGYATYHARITADSLPERLSIDMPTIATAYDLYVNGVKLFSAGVPGTSRETSTPSYNPQVVDFTSRHDTIDIVVHVSNYYHQKGGFWEEAILGEQTVIWSGQRFALIMAFLVGGVLLLNGLYHIGMYPIHTYTKSPYYFGLFSITLAMRTFVTGYVPIQYITTTWPWWLLIRIEFLTVYFGMPLFLHYMHTVFTHEKISKVYYGLLSCYALLAISVLITPARIFTRGLNFFLLIGLLSVVYGIFVMIWAIKNKRDGAVAFFTATIILIAAFINDLLVAFEVIFTGYVIQYGLVIFIMIQALLLAYRLTYAFKTVDRQREELVVHKEHLEDLVAERTEKLIESNTMKELLLDIITHDLKNPAGVIHGMAKLLKDDKPADELIGTIHSSSVNLLKVIENATTLSKVAIGERVEKESLDLVQMMKEAADSFAPSLKNVGMTVATDLPEKMFIMANPILIEVFKNFISNAIKYAQKGKKILLKISWDLEKITASVIDYGETIQEEDRSSIFERSLQLNIKNKGRGLGLAIVKRIAEVHDGNVGTRPGESTGNEFYITLPVSGETADQVGES